MIRSMMKRGDIKEQEIYEVFIKTYISKGLIREALPYLKKSVEMSDDYNAVTIVILLYRLFGELNDESKIIIIKLFSLLYAEPLRLLNCVEQLLVKDMTSLEISKYLNSYYNEIKELNLLNYNPDNLVFNTHFRTSSDQSESIAKN